MRRVQDRAAGRLVNAARLHADVAVLDQVDAADAVFRADVVQRCQELSRREPLAVHRDRIAASVIDLDVLRPVRRLFHRPAPDEHIRRRLLPRIFEDAAFVADVKQIAIGAVGLRFRHRHGNAVFARIGDQ